LLMFVAECGGGWILTWPIPIKGASARRNRHGPKGSTAELRELGTVVGCRDSDRVAIVDLSRSHDGSITHRAFVCPRLMADFFRLNPRQHHRDAAVRTTRPQ
jgi:hypothetical protein